MGAARFLLFVILCASLAACAGFRPVAPEPQRVYAGEVSSIVLPEPPPEGEALTWSTGDGSPPIEGRVLEHAWQRPGIYTVVVEGSGGRDEFEVEVEPRPVLRAIPAQARVAAAVPGAWSRFAEYVDFATRVAPGSDVTAMLGRIREKLGADPTVPAELVEVGIDPAEGIGFVTFDFDPDATWILIGILDEARAVATMRRLFDLGSMLAGSTPDGTLYLASSKTGERQNFGIAGGYLAIRGGDNLGLALSAPPSGESAPGGYAQVFGPPELLLVAEKRKPDHSLQVIQALANAGAGLAGSPAFQVARAMAPGDDIVFFAQTPNDSGGSLPMVVGVELGGSAVVANYGVALSPDDVASASAVLAGRATPGPALARYPTGALAFLGLSIDPVAVVTEAIPNPMQRALISGVVADKTGVPLEQLVASITGNASAGLYFDPEAFTEIAVALIAGGDPGDDALPPLFARVELRSGAAARQIVERALANATQPTADGWWQRGPVFFRLEEGVLEIATLRARHLRPQPKGIVDFSGLVPAEAGTQAFYVDVAGIVDGLRQSEAESAESAVVRALLLEEAAFLEPIRSVLFTGRTVPGGTAGALRIELRPEP